MEPTAAGNLLEIMDLARTLRQEQLFIQHEQAAFAQLTGALETNAATITKVRTHIYILTMSRRIALYLINISALFYLPSFSWRTSALNKDRTCMICCWPERITIRFSVADVPAPTIMPHLWMPNRCCPTRWVTQNEIYVFIFIYTIYIHVSCAYQLAWAHANPDNKEHFPMRIEETFI